MEKRPGTFALGSFDEPGQQPHEPASEDRADEQHPRRVCRDQLREPGKGRGLNDPERQADRDGEQATAEEVTDTDERPEPPEIGERGAPIEHRERGEGRVLGKEDRPSATNT
jgi:hypothetical protein